MAVRAVLYFAIAFPLLVLIAAGAFAGRATGQIVIEPLARDPPLYRGR